MAEGAHCLLPSDLVCIERLLGHVMPEGLKAYLQGSFGAGSDYQRIRLWAQERQECCDRRCETCCACCLEQGDSLFVRVFRIVSCFERGVFDVAEDDYEDACRELAFHWWRHDDPERPF